MLFNERHLCRERILRQSGIMRQRRFAELPDYMEVLRIKRNFAR